MNTPTSSTASETTDWETVFESPDQGLIPLVEAAETVFSLKTTSASIIADLFTRVDDENLRNTILDQLDAIIPDSAMRANIDTLELVLFKKKVKKLLRQIKEFRIKKAREYIKNKHKAKAVERRDLDKNPDPPDK